MRSSRSTDRISHKYGNQDKRHSIGLAIERRQKGAMGELEHQLKNSTEMSLAQRTMTLRIGKLLDNARQQSQLTDRDDRIETQCIDDS